MNYEFQFFPQRSLKSLKKDFRISVSDLFEQECRNLWLLSFSIFLNFLAFKRRQQHSVVIGGKRIDGICWPHTLVSAVGTDRAELRTFGHRPLWLYYRETPFHTVWKLKKKVSWWATKNVCTYGLIWIFALKQDWLPPFEEFLRFKWDFLTDFQACVKSLNWLVYIRPCLNKYEQSWRRWRRLLILWDCW